MQKRSTKVFKLSSSVAKFYGVDRIFRSIIDSGSMEVFWRKDDLQMVTKFET